MIQTEADRPVSKKWIVLLREKMLVPRHRFVAAEIQRADHHRRGRQRLRHLLVGEILLLLAGDVPRVQIKKLRAVKPHAVRQVFFHERRLVHRLDVRAQRDGHAVQRHRRPAVRLEQPLLEAFFLNLDLLVAEKRLLRRIEDHHALVTVHQQPVARLHLLGQVAHADHRRHFHRTRHDHRVARLAARVRHDPQRLRAVDARRVRGRNIIGDHHALLHQLA